MQRRGCHLHRACVRSQSIAQANSGSQAQSVAQAFASAYSQGALLTLSCRFLFSLILALRAVMGCCCHHMWLWLEPDAAQSSPWVCAAQPATQGLTRPSHRQPRKPSRLRPRRTPRQPHMLPAVLHPLHVHPHVGCRQAAVLTGVLVHACTPQAAATAFAAAASSVLLLDPWAVCAANQAATALAVRAAKLLLQHLEPRRGAGILTGKDAYICVQVAKAFAMGGSTASSMAAAVAQAINQFGCSAVQPTLAREAPPPQLSFRTIHHGHSRARMYMRMQAHCPQRPQVAIFG